MRLPLIVDIGRGSREDGPGIRSVVFFKGCLLRCVFCQSPEAQELDAEIAFHASRCAHCGACAEACEVAAIALTRPHRIQRDRCVGCGACAEACVWGALRRIGQYRSPQSLVEELLRDLPYYQSSGGGVTLSGGEPALHPEYVEALLRLLKASGVHVAVETGGCFDYGAFRSRILPYVDLVYFDLKFVDPELNRRYTGRGNRRIVRNLQRLLQERRDVVQVRTPLVPGITDTCENLSGIAELLRHLGARTVELLPYNPLGAGMYEALGRRPPALPDHFQTPAELERVCGIFRDILATRASPSRVSGTQP